MKNSRRDFLKAVAVLAVASSQLAKAEKGRPQSRDRLKSGHQIIGMKRGLKIKSVETFTRGSLSIVRVCTDDGTEGYGQIAPSNADISAMVLHRQIARHALGKDPADLDPIVDECIEANYKFPWSYVCRALAGLDTALWDVRGRCEKKSVCELLGGKCRPIVAYGSSMRRDIKPDDEAKRLVRLRDTKGFRAFKVRVGKRCGHDQDQWTGRTETLIPTVRKAVGNEVSLLVDANSCYTPPKAIAVGRILEEYGFCHFEEPCPYWELEWTAKVAAAINVPVAGGEQDNDLAQWRRMIRMRAVDIVQPDICYIGGLTRALRVAAMAAKANRACVPHSANLSMVTVFTLHMLGAIGNAGPYVEFSIEPTGWVKDMYHPTLQVRDGKVAIPDGPGWGVTVNPKWLAKAKRRISRRP